MKTKHLLASITLLAMLQGCAHTPPSAASLQGTWHTAAPDGAEAELLVRADNSFHVDLTDRQGIEVEGTVEMEGDTATFINTSGTDETSRNPAPGSYRWHITGSELAFTKIEDPLDRRARMLALPWERRD